MIFSKNIYLRKYIFKPYLNNSGAGRILAYILYIGLLESFLCMNRFHWHHSLTPLSHQDHIDRLKKLMIDTFMFLLFFRKNKPSQRGKEWNSSLQVSHFSPIMLALQVHFPSLLHCSLNDPSTLQTQARFFKWAL